MFRGCEPIGTCASRRLLDTPHVRRGSQPRHLFSTTLICTYVSFFILGGLPTVGGQGGGETSSEFPVEADDIRFFNNLTEQRTGAPTKLWIRDPNQYSRIFFSQREGELSTEVLEGIIRGEDVVLDIGANVGVFALSAAKLGARVVAVEADGSFAASVSEGARINGLEDRVLVAEWLPSSREGFATVFAKGERGCTYTGPATCNMTGEQEYVRAVRLVTFLSSSLALPAHAFRISAHTSDSLSSPQSIKGPPPPPFRGATFLSFETSSIRSSVPSPLPAKQPLLTRSGMVRAACRILESHANRQLHRWSSKTTNQSSNALPHEPRSRPSGSDHSKIPSISPSALPPQVTARTVDGALGNGMIPWPTVVRIDAEGSEEAVLEGARGLLEMSLSQGAPRLVLIVVYPYQLRRVLQWMQARGYQVAVPLLFTALHVKRWDATLREMGGER